MKVSAFFSDFQTLNIDCDVSDPTAFLTVKNHVNFLETEAAPKPHRDLNHWSKVSHHFNYHLSASFPSSRTPGSEINSCTMASKLILGRPIWGAEGRGQIPIIHNFLNEYKFFFILAKSELKVCLKLWFCQNWIFEHKLNFRDQF